MQFQLILLLLLALPALASEDQEIQELFKKYELVMSKNNKTLVPQVFSEKFLLDHGGEKEFSQNIGQVPIGPYVLDIKPGALDKDIRHVKLVPRGSKAASENIFILKRRPTGAWQIEGTISNDN